MVIEAEYSLGTPEQTGLKGEALLPDCIYKMPWLLPATAKDIPRIPFLDQGSSAVPEPWDCRDLASMLVLPQPWGHLAQEFLGKGTEPSRPAGNSLLTLGQA